jgi:glycosyltransferase involved in cell wall biosynthesis
VTGKRTAVFVINLVQDVNILRPLVFMATRSFGFEAMLLVSSRFSARDLYGIWRAELDELCAETGARLEVYESEWQAFQLLKGTGLIFAASESHLPNHVTTHDIFRLAPPRFLKVTLQHGFECVGFRHSAAHDRAHGQTVSFGADIVCAWQGPEFQTSMATSQRAKVHLTGPTAVLQQFTGPIKRGRGNAGVVCENLHSVRLNSTEDLKGEFVGAFEDFCRLLDRDRREVVLRPHPGGQYVLKNKVVLPANARINNAPMYRLDLRQFSYGISAPSSVLIDMLLAGIPTAVWRDQAGGMDADNYAGLTTVSSPRDWFEFSQAAIRDPAPFIEIQQEFLQRQQMPLEPQVVFSRFAELFQSAQRMNAPSIRTGRERERILFVANANVPTLQLSFEKPLAPLVSRGEIVTDLLTEEELRESPVLGDAAAEAKWIDRRIGDFEPTVIIFCRYSGPASDQMLDWARRNQVPVIYHIDDDLLAIPPDIGQRKFELHNAPERLAAVRNLLAGADLVYASTDKLRERLLDYFPDLRVSAGKVYCSGEVLRSPSRGPARTVGYMASADHAHNLDMVLPAIERLMDSYPQVRFELFGSIPVPPSLERFGDRVTTAPPVANYAKFLDEFAAREWDVGICPLVPIDFNMMKADTKWVEYTSSGVAVVASAGTVYDRCCARNCGILAETTDDWFEALSLLVSDEEARSGLVQNAQAKLEHEYSVGRLREQVLHIIDQSRSERSEVSDEIGELEDCQTA